MFLFNQSSWKWIIRYKLYHIPFWVMYHLTWWTVTVGSPFIVADDIIHSPFGIKTAFYVVVQALGVYFNLYFLIPRLLERGRYVLYIISVILTIIAMAALIVPGYYFSAYLSHTTVAELYKADPENLLYFIQVNTLSSSTAAMTLAMSVKLTKNWLQSRRQAEVLQKEKLETELKFLRSQFHPHFLFNTINSIFVLIRKDPNKATDALDKFSSLLRYQLYECNEPRIPLRQELTYISNYFDLQKLRAENITLSFRLPRLPTEDFFIAPFILVPFIENAFKHVSRRKNAENNISIEMDIKHQILHLEVRNSVDPSERKAENSDGYSGIGHENIRRRLELIYKDKHNLSIDSNNTAFTVRLTLDVGESPQSYQPAEHPEYLINTSLQ